MEDLYSEEYFNDFSSFEIYLEDILSNQELYYEQSLSIQNSKLEILKSSLFIQTSLFVGLLGFLSIVVFLRSVFRNVGN